MIRPIPSIRVVVADDQRVVREGLTMLVGLIDGVAVVGTASDGVDAVEQARRERPDVVLMDLRMPRMEGAEATRVIRSALPETQVLVLTTYADDESLFPALRAGARGYLTKDASAEEIERAIRAVVAGRTHLDPAVQQRLVDALVDIGPPAAGGPATDAPGAASPGSASPGSMSLRSDSPGSALPGRGATPATRPARPNPEPPDDLTPREVEVLKLIASGLSNAEIADALVVSGATVKTHVNRIFYKTGARDRAQAVIYAGRHGIA